MAETVIVRGEGGALFEMDVPTEGHRLELWEHNLTTGRLTVLPSDAAEWVEDADGTRHLVAVVAADPEPKGRKAKADSEG